jgi:hypothetical protein
VRRLLTALTLSVPLALAQARPAEASCALRADALQALFAAANDADAAARAARERELALASEGWATQGCGALDLSVDELWVHAGDVRVVPGGARILAANGAAVLGALEVRGAGGVALATVLGDLVLEGTLDARGGQDAPLRLEARTGNVRVGRAFALVAPRAKIAVSAGAGAILFAPRGAGDSAPFPPDAEIAAFHDPAPEPGSDATELSGR